MKDRGPKSLDPNREWKKKSEQSAGLSKFVSWVAQGMAATWNKWFVEADIFCSTTDNQHAEEPYQFLTKCVCSHM